jgi:hypothetical protein
LEFRRKESKNLYALVESQNDREIVATGVDLASIFECEDFGIRHFSEYGNVQIIQNRKYLEDADFTRECLEPGRSRFLVDTNVGPRSPYFRTTVRRNASNCLWMSTPTCAICARASSMHLSHQR